MVAHSITTFRFRLSAYYELISRLLMRMKIVTVARSVAHVAYAAPIVPCCGIRKRLSAIFTNAPLMVKIRKNLLKFSAIR